MQYIAGKILLSASDLVRFTGCTHATFLDLQRLRGEGPEPSEDSEDAVLLQKQGDAHEATHLERLKSAGKDVTSIPRRDLSTDTAATRSALTAGSEVIFQGAFLSGNWGGWSDFLMRVDRPSALGSFSYEVSDTKLKRQAHPKHVLQLVLYSDLLTEIQDTAPEFAYVELGNGKRATLRLADYAYYARKARARLEEFVAAPKSTRPIPCADCSLCRWADHCQSVWLREDSLFNVANISRGQVKKLEAAGITTMEALAELDHPVRGMAEPTRLRLITQGRLQYSRKSGPAAFEFRAPERGKGFDLLPEPQPGDIFYDIEGDPHYEGALEYLHGVWCDGKFRAFWAHDHEAEAQALAELFEFFRSRLEAFPNGRIYHYAPYEITALRRLTGKYGIGEVYLDRLLRERRFVDLFAVVRGALICSEANYSIKSLEAFYDFAREGEVKTAGGSVVAYEKWRETGEQAILDEIESYNRADCESTEKLRNWLLSVRPEGAWPQFTVDGAGKELEEESAVTALRTELKGTDLSEERQNTLFHLARYHSREKKAAWWVIFDSLAKEEDALVDDLDALGGLVAMGPGQPIKRSIKRDYGFPVQETKLRAGKRATVPTLDGSTTVGIEFLDRRKRIVTLKIGAERADLLADKMTLHPDQPTDTDGIAAALRDVLADQCGAGRYRAVCDLLSRAPPRLTGAGPIIGTEDLSADVVSAVRRMDETVLPIQGPPGTGKTYVAARAILALVRDGYRVGVCSNSHEAIRNVLMGCVDACLVDSSPVPEIIHKVSEDQVQYPDSSPVRRTSKDTDAYVNGRVVGGTMFFMSHEQNIQKFDWLFVDEAGQVGLANMTAIARAARNIVLIGDPRQLPQVIQGAHPEPASLSCLEWLLGEHATIPADRGIFLGVTRRMHPAVNHFISEQVYEGRLFSSEDTANQRVLDTRYPAAGAFWVPVEHEGNAQVADEEVEAIRSACYDLLSGRWIDKHGEERVIYARDIIVVAPYNAQVNALRDAVPEGVRVGTVDKFQGQEAPICLVSMTASSAEESPRGLEFLLSINRINVAISRAKALALVFGSPRLREAKCTTIEQMRLINNLCALKEINLLN